MILPDYQSLLGMMEAARMGWWTIDLTSGTFYFSDSLVRLAGLSTNRMPKEEVAALTEPDYRERIADRLLNLRTEGPFDETFPIHTPSGTRWFHAQVTGKQADLNKGMRLIGYAQQVDIDAIEEAEAQTLRSHYYTALRAQRHMDELLEQLPIGYIRIRLLYDEEGRAADFLFLTINRMARKILGHKSDRYTDRTARELDIPIDHYIDSIASLHTASYKVNEWRAPRTGRYCRSFLYNTPNDPTEIVILILDITDVRQAHQALEEQRKLLQNILLTAPVGIEIYDARGRLVMVNQHDREIFGVERNEEMLGIRIFDNPNFSKEIRTAIRRGEEIDFSSHYDFALTEGYYRSSRRGTFDWTARIRCLYDASGARSHYLLINIDNTELRQTQDRLAEFETLFNRVTEYAHVGYANYNLCSLEGYAHNTWLRNYGEQETQTIDRVIFRYSHVVAEDRKKLLEALEQFRAGAMRSSTCTCRIRHDDGSLHWINTHLLCREYNPERGVIDMLGINYDITPLKETEQALIAAKERAEEANKLKSAFLANMSHEIRTPLNAIVGFSELLAEEEETETRREYIDIISRNNDLLLQIISDVLDLARIESGRTETVRTRFDLRDLCCETADSLRLQAPPGVQLRTADDLPSVMICQYRQGLCQILGNFTRNAMKFTREGFITIGFEHRGDRLRLFVRDTGIGIAAEELPRVFDRFYKIDTFTQGTGLGLPICRSIAEQIGCRVDAESAPGEGSCFWVDIPLQEEETATADIPNFS